MQHPTQTALRAMPVPDALTQIALYVSHELSNMSGCDVILNGIDACLAEIAEEDRRDCWGFESDQRAYRSAQAGIGA
jgi:hypothetical protein